jgi:hypothetical protein
MRSIDFCFPRGPSLVRAAAAAALALAALSPVPVSAQSGCPENMIAAGCCCDAVGVPSTEPTLDVGHGAWLVNTPCQSGGCYDLRNGRFVARATGNPYSESCNMLVRTTDVYEITGVPVGVPYSFFAELYVHGTFVAPGNVYIDLEVDVPNGAEVSAVFGSPATSVEEVVRLPLVYEAGQPFPLIVRISASGLHPGGSANTFSELWFSGLPAGARVVSCQDYDVPVPARAGTWGELKAIYRD